mmetsp:Transcript_22633/g.33123  ORF Transcript_22633/g.33123 Transcript_22633/m.33123 type:complete len:232 (+) Transcript_22633:386-1081(+)
MIRTTIPSIIWSTAWVPVLIWRREWITLELTRRSIPLWRLVHNFTTRWASRGLPQGCHLLLLRSCWFLLSVYGRFGCAHVQSLSQCLTCLCLSLFISHLIVIPIVLILLQESSSTIPYNQNDSSCNLWLLLAPTKQIRRLKLLNQRTESSISNLCICSTTSTTENIMCIDICTLVTDWSSRLRGKRFTGWIRNVEIHLLRRRGFGHAGRNGSLGSAARLGFRRRRHTSFGT